MIFTLEFFQIFLFTNSTKKKTMTLQLILIQVLKQNYVSFFPFKSVRRYLDCWSEIYLYDSTLAAFSAWCLKFIKFYLWSLQNRAAFIKHVSVYVCVCVCERERIILYFLKIFI